MALIFDTDGSVIMCNYLHRYPIGRYGEDFENAEELRLFRESKRTNDNYTTVLRSPSERCASCDLFSHCGGGCVMYWFKYSFDELMEMKIIFENDNQNLIQDLQQKYTGISN